MRAVLQRVSRARVVVEEQVTGEIAQGLVVLLGIEQGDTESDADYLANKIAGLRIFQDDEGRMNRSVQETGGAVLVISQFTLYGDTRKGRRPSFDRAARPDCAKHLYEYFVGRMRQTGLSVATGVFQATMSVELVNEGPVTLICESVRFSPES